MFATPPDPPLRATDPAGVTATTLPPGGPPRRAAPPAGRRALIRLLARIDRKLGVLVRGRDRPPGGLLTIAQAAARAGVSPTTIRRAIALRDGPDKLAAYDQSLGRKKASWRIDPAALDAWRTRHEVKPPAPAVRTVRGAGRKAGQFKF